VPLWGGSNRIEFPEALNRHRLRGSSGTFEPREGGASLNLEYILSYLEKNLVTISNVQEVFLLQWLSV
jgi:hypothetical protein